MVLPPPPPIKINSFFFLLYKIDRYFIHNIFIYILLYLVIYYYIWLYNFFKLYIHIYNIIFGYTNIIIWLYNFFFRIYFIYVNYIYGPCLKNKMMDLSPKHESNLMSKTGIKFSKSSEYTSKDEIFKSMNRVARFIHQKYPGIFNINHPNHTPVTDELINNLKNLNVNVPKDLKK